ncbi:MAG: hypothetical protein LBB08_03020, partial [Rickettsiales bacterium]|nr:hypothetical protein [Rickettsiales bacterium]
MKRIEILFIFYALTAFTAGAANAAAMCASTGVFADIRAGNSQLKMGWGGMWGVLYNNRLIEGIAMCGSSSSDSLSQSLGKFCWCRMTRPVLGSKWVF